MFGLHRIGDLSLHHTPNQFGDSRMNNTIKALLGAALLTVVMTGCETMAERSAANCPDGQVCNITMCDDEANCDPSTCEMKDCPKKVADCASDKKADCDKSAKADCDKEAKAAKAACPSGKPAMKCGENCTKPCCA